MITALFLICVLEDQKCFVQGAAQFFATNEECLAHVYNQELLWTNDPNLPPHKVVHRCVNWGQPA